MTEKHILEAQRNIGVRAKEFRGSDLVSTAFQELEDQYLGDLLNTEPEDGELREMAYLQLRVLKDIQQKFITMIARGLGADAELKAEAAQKEAESAKSRG